MQPIRITRYQCELCKALYTSKDQAIECESKPVSHDKGVKVGDLVIVTAGEGAGATAKVTEVFVIDKDWGHYYREQYHHTVAIAAELTTYPYGSRYLPYDHYKPLEN
jgi:hypothetical protein